MRKLISWFKKAATTVGTTIKDAFLAVIRAARATARVTVNAVVATVVFIGSTTVAMFYLLLTAVLWTLSALGVLIQKTLALITLVVMLPFLVFYGKHVIAQTFRTMWAILSDWNTIDVTSALNLAIGRLVAKRETVVIEVQATQAPAEARKGRPTPKQHTRRPARLDVHPKTA